MNIPNLLTVLRLALIPVFVGVYYLPFSWSALAATLVFGFAALTDWFDGYLARRLNQTTPFGAFLDPVADKLMVATALTLLVQTYGSYLMTIPAIIIIGREIAISALREWMAERGERNSVAVSGIGKVKTTFQMIAIFLLLYAEPYTLIANLGLVSLIIASVLTLWSMVIYLRGAWSSLFSEEI